MSEILELRDALARIIKGENEHAAAIRKQEAAEGGPIRDAHFIRSTRDDADRAYADFVTAWPLRRVNRVLNKAAEATDPEFAADRRQARMSRLYGGRKRA